MRSIFVAFVLMLLIIAGAFYYVCFTPSLVLKNLPSFAEAYLQDARLLSVSIKGQSYEYPETLKLFGITAEIEAESEIYQLEIDEFRFLNFRAFSKDKNRAVLTLLGLNLQKKNLHLSRGNMDVTFELNGRSLSRYSGILHSADMNLNPYLLSGVQGKFEGSPQGFMIPEFTASAYGGQVKGEIKVEIKPKSTETIYLEFRGLRDQELQTLNKSLFSRLSGEFRGNMRMTRADRQLQLLSIFAEIKSGGTVTKELGQKIQSYMTDEKNRYAVGQILEAKGRLDFDAAEFRILNVNQNLAGVTITLENKSDRYRIHETINLDISRILQGISWKF